MTQEQAVEETLPIVNELLLGANPIGAYGMGAICAMHWQACLVPSRELLVGARHCVSVESVNALCKWLEGKLGEAQGAGA